MPRIEAEIRRLGTFQLAAARNLRPEDVRIKHEPDGEASIVTRWDTESETQLRDFVQREFPGHSFLGEEFGNDCRDPAHYWLSDPIDGTSNFVDGIPFWGTSLAYWRDGMPQLGIIYFPALDRMFTAVRGVGALSNGAVLRTPAVNAYTPLGCIGLDSRSHQRHHLKLRSRVRILGSAIANLCWTASGGFEASCTRAKLWDLAAGVLLLREAGAVAETEPDLDRLDPAMYARAVAGDAPRISLYARATPALPDLRQYLQPVPSLRG